MRNLLSWKTSVVLIVAVTAGAANASDVDSRERSSNPEAVAGSNCLTNKTAFVVRDDLVSTTSTTFVLMPGTRRTVTTSALGCVIVQFSGELTTQDANHRPFLRVVANGVATAEPIEVRAGFPVSPSNFELRSMQFVFNSLPADTYDFRLLWRTSGNTAFTEARTLTIHHR